MEALFILLAAVIALCIGVKHLLAKRRNDQRKRQCSMAEVVHLRMENPSGHYGRGLYTRYYATFRLENAGEQTFSIPASEYDRLSLGDRGELTYRGWQYLFFSKRA